MRSLAADGQRRSAHHIFPATWLFRNAGIVSASLDPGLSCSVMTKPARAHAARRSRVGGTMLRQLFFGGVFSLANIAIHALAMASVISASRAASARRVAW